MQLVPERVLAGEVWRLFTFLAMPPSENLLLALIFWSFFYFTGNAMESTWGAFRYNVYLLIGYFATVAAAFVFPDQPVSNGFLQGSVFLAFAYLYPDFVVQLYFILPIKVKWLALLQWVAYAWAFAGGDWPTRLIVAASVLNFFVFFGKDLFQRVQGRRRRMAWQAKTHVDKDKPFHRCLVCGITDKTHPQMEFRYCSKCAGACGYCSEHIRNHEHVTESKDAVQT